jgi:hypothetical protein
MAEERFANTTFTIDGQTIPCVTTFNVSYSIDEDEITCSTDVVGEAGEEINRRRFLATAAGQTAAMDGIVHRDVASYDTFETAAKTGKTVDINRTTASGESKTYTGHFTDFNENGTIGEVWKFTATFRINDEVAVS